MDSQDSSIEEKLVPFVEGALAEADRREVLQALPNQPALNQEVRQLREAIMSLRGQAARGLTYQSPVEAPPEQVVDYALQGEQWSRQSSRLFQLHLLESSSLNQELEILRELEQDLQQRVEPSKAVPEMPAALRQAIQETYGKPPADPAWKRAAAAIVAWTAGLNLKVASAAVAGCVLVVGAVTVARMNHQSTGSAGNTVAVATTAPVAASASPTLAAVASPAPAPAGQVALLQEKVLPEDLPGLSRRLWTKQVSHSYRDGQIYVAQADFDKAWAALQMNDEKAASSKALKTGGIAINDKRTNLLDGVIGQLPADRKAEEVKLKQAPKPVAAPAPAPAPVAAAATSAGQAPAAQPGNMVGGVPDSKVAIDLPAAPENSQGAYAPPPAPPPSYDAAPQYYRQKERARVADPVVPRQTAPAPAPIRRPHTAAGSAHTTAAPAQTAHAGPTSGGAKDAGTVAPGNAPGTSQTKIGQVFQPARKQQPAIAKNANRPVDQVAIETRTEPPTTEAPAPPIEALQKPTAPPRPISAPEPQAPRPKAPAITPPPAPVAMSNSNAEMAGEEEGTPPVPAPVLQDQKKAEVRRDKGDTEDGRVTIAAAPTRSDDALRANAGSSRASMSAQAGRSGVARDEGFQVKAGAPFEVAMLPVAKKLVEDQVGEAKVQMERKEDGHLLVTIRPARSLSPQEVDKLRKVVREKLELKEEDTVVIRQP